MKKAINALVAVFATVAMAIAGFVGAGSAFADETYSLTVSGTGHTYNIYQIFTGTPSNGKLTDVKWGQNGTGAVGSAVDDSTLTAIAAVSGTDQKKADALKTYANLSGNAFTSVASGAAASVPAGYYLVKDQDNSQKDKDDAYTTYIVKVVDSNVAVNPKSDVPSFEKKVKDTNDTTGETSGWQDSADYDFGDAVPFQLKATLPNNYSDYKTYYLAFHDVEEEGLSFNKDSVKVSIDGQTVDAANYTVKTKADGLTDGCTFEVVFKDLKSTAAKNGSEVTVEYTSTLTEQANLGQQGNVNQAKLQFSNNPNSEQEGENGPTGETPWDNVIVFTYKVTVNKVDQNQKSLKGAAFKLEKTYKDGSTKLVKEFTSDDGTKFTFSGLDDGDYILTETTTPAGYNSIKPITFTVTADHKIVWGDTDQRTDILTSVSGDKASGEITFTSDGDKNLATNVVNKSGSSLPETGGMGTIVLYVAGAALVIAAGAYFALRKKSAR